MTDKKDNPLLKPFTAPHGAPPLDQLKAEHFLPAVREGIAAAKRDIEAIKNNPAKPDFKNTIEALEFSGGLISKVMPIFGNMAGANSNDDIRAIEEQVDAEITTYSNDIMLDEKLFQRVKAVHDMKEQLALDGEQKMLLDKTYKGFVRNGALLPEQDKEKLRQIDEQLSKLGTRFSQNGVKAVQEYQKVIDREEDLAGLPARAKNNYKAAAEKEGLSGKWLIKLSPPPTDIMQYSENRTLREEIYRANTSVGYKGKYDNSPVILEMVKLRHERAQLLGFDTHADFVLDERMAKSSETVMDFLHRNAEVYRPAAEAWLDKVRDYAKKTDGVADIKPWDLGYYGRKLQEETFKLDLESLRPFFEVNKVLEGIRQHAEKLFHIDMKETSGVYPVAHPSIKVYEVTDKASGEMIGLFYADYFARPGAKQSGAWMGTFRDRGLEDGKDLFALVTNTCNFSEPTKDQPSLLSLDDVRTVFHEFGHGLHALMAKGKYKSLTGTSVKWDFVELPSQLQENWAKEKEVLDTFAVHYKTGEKLSAEMIKKINDMETFDAGYMGLRQTFLGLLDMKWHATDPATIKTVEELEDAVIAASWLFQREAGPMSTNFSHLFAGGYSAGYYSYKWAEVLEADVFEEFAKKGLYHAETAKKLRETIYSKGGTVDPNDLFKEMMGRDPNPEALFRREGLNPPKKPPANKNKVPPPAA